MKYPEDYINKIICGDCLDVMKDIPDNSIDAVVTDPPYELSFMGKQWDGTGVAFRVEIWQECLRVLKPGGYLLSFGGTRTYHRMACAIENAEFEIRDMIDWVYGSGFPKSHNIGKAVDKLQGNERIKTGGIKHHAQKGVAVAEERGSIGGGAFGQAKDEEITKGNSEWEGWGTAIKPAHEPICMARKPLSEKSIAENVLKWGTGGLNIDRSRVGNETIQQRQATVIGGKAIGGKGTGIPQKANGIITQTQGRFPANLIHDGSDEVVRLFPETKSGKMKQHINGGKYNVYGEMYPRDVETIGDSGSAARFFYCAKASKAERNMGCENMPLGKPVRWNKGGEWTNDTTPAKNNHPTVKPLKLMKYLINMVTRKGSVVLDPFTGSGTTCVACKELKRKYIGIELDSDYCQIAQAKAEAANPEVSQNELF